MLLPPSDRREREWCGVPEIDRSMTRAEYMRWRKEVRRINRYGPVFYSGLWLPSDREVNTATFERVARQLAMQVRIARNKVRHGLPI